MCNYISLNQQEREERVNNNVARFALKKVVERREKLFNEWYQNKHTRSYQLQHERDARPVFVCFGSVHLDRHENHTSDLPSQQHYQHVVEEVLLLLNL